MKIRGQWLAVIGALGMLAAAGGCSGSSNEGGTPSSGGGAGAGATGGGGSAGAGATGGGGSAGAGATGGGGSAGAGATSGGGGAGGQGGAAGAAGSSGAGSCTPGAKQCSGSTPQTCSSSGAWESGSACAGATPSCYAGACVSQPSCAVDGGGRTNCGTGGNESCCTSLSVKGGTFYRDYTDPPTGDYWTKNYPATVADFRLDKYEVTVGRFRKFVEAWVGGWRPVAGAGKHMHLNGGLGLVNSGAGGGNEPGWDASWSSGLAQSTVDWDTNLACDPDYQTWTPSAGGNENRPINCASWSELYAFCIWDGGFLPSEAESHYAASGGSEQRKYPWGSNDPGANADLAIYGCYYNGSGSCTGVTNIAPVGSAPNGAGKWGQQDLAGNVWEWRLDWRANAYDVSCNDCAHTTPASSRVVLGGDFHDIASVLLSPYRFDYNPSYRSRALGGRCARTP
ncbi:MAG: formylglycine-generating enzyme family protein [Sorangiineae bacterium]|nr:formylglycine-generating enzyme family protein [Polyangiaceae bacterium]MEB2320998.1 formylglycine-generating enzyme family protein [Sorangiineae bacterium]